MSDEVSICNLALGHLGDAAEVVSINPPDGSAQAGWCAQFYPIARGLLLEMMPWNFATTRASLTPFTLPSLMVNDWGYAYVLPAQFLRPLEAISPNMPTRWFSNELDGGCRFVTEANEDGDLILYTNVETATLRYTRLVTDTSKYPPMFTAALARLLASYLAGPLLKGAEGVKVSQQQLEIFAKVEYVQAAVMNANATKRGPWLHTPPWLATRTLPTTADLYRAGLR